MHLSYLRILTQYMLLPVILSTLKLVRTVRHAQTHLSREHVLLHNVNSAKDADSHYGVL